MDALELVNLNQLLTQTTGSPDVVIGLIDGPVDQTLPDFQNRRIRQLAGNHTSAGNLAAASHGTAVASILIGRRGSGVPAICPDCALLSRPIFSQSTGVAAATPEEAAAAIVDCVDAGARLLNLSAAFVPTTIDQRPVQQALQHAASEGALVIAAAGNQGTVGSSVITRHPWVIPVAACGLDGVPARSTNLSRTIGLGGLLAPSQGIAALAPGGSLRPFGGTSAAVPFVTGAAALLWSQFPRATPAQIRAALLPGRRRAALTPPLLNAWAAYQYLQSDSASRR